MVVSSEQNAGLKDFPAFVPAKVSIQIQRKLPGTTGKLELVEDNGEYWEVDGQDTFWEGQYSKGWVELPFGEYEAEFKYADQYWNVYMYDGNWKTFTVDAETIPGTDVEAVFMPFGVDFYYDDLREDFEQEWKVDAAGAATATVPAGVATIAAGAFAEAGSLASVRFGGDAPEVEAGGLDGLPETAVVRVARGTAGWGEVPGKWQGRSVVYDSLAELPEDATAALDSPHAAASWRLGTPAPLANEPVAVLGLPPDADAVGGATVVSVLVQDDGEPAEVDLARVAAMLETASTPLDWSEVGRLSPAIEESPAGDDGSLRFSVTPDNAPMPSAFFRLRME